MKVIGRMVLATLCFSTAASAQHYQQTNFISDPSITRIAEETAYTVSVRDLAGNAMVSAPVEGSPQIARCIAAGSAAVLCLRPITAVLNTASDFAMGEGEARVIFVSQNGTISGWNPAMSAGRAVPKVDHSGHANYQGAAIGNFNGVPYLYVANFGSQKIEVYDPRFRHAKNLEKAFREGAPRGLAPTNIQNIGGNLVITYAKRNSNRTDSVAGLGVGYVDMVTTSGKSVTQFEQGSWLDAPRGIAVAPEDFGDLSGALLIGNGGSGQIAAYDLQTGRFISLLKDGHDAVLSVPGLWALTASAPAPEGSNGSVLFSADAPGESGVFGMFTHMP